MKLEHTYIKKLLESVEGIQSARPRLSELIKAMGLEDIDDKFLLHYEVLFDYCFIDVPSGSIGIKQSADGVYYWSDISLRLTAQGHEFIQAIEKIEVWDVIKAEFKESSVKTVFNVATDIIKSMTKKKLEKILAEK